MLLALVLACALSGCGSSSESPAESLPAHLSLEANAKYRFDGWGVSLAWWANVIGDDQPAGQPAGSGGQWPSEERDRVLAALFGDPTQPSGHSWASQVHPLGLNVLRYNIGASPSGSEDQAVKMLPDKNCRRFRAGAVVPTPIESEGAQPQLELDARQIDVLVRAKKLIEQSSGAPILEAFANSPPWWLTSNQCPAGQPSVVRAEPGPNPSPNQPRPRRFYPYDPFKETLTGADTYARYLLDVVSAFSQMGIRFTTVEPFNEPNDGFWGNCSDGKHPHCSGGCNPSNCQEGSNLSPDVQAAVVDALCRHLKDTAYAPLHTSVSANDENTLERLVPDGGDAAPWLQSSCDSQINVHGYGGLQYRSALRHLADAKQTQTGDQMAPPMWMSEYGLGPCNKDDTADTCSGLELAKQIAGDLQDLRPSAWVYWQALEANGGWGLLHDDFPHPPSSRAPLTLTSRYWALSQYTRYIRPGAAIYPLSLPENAYSTNGGQPSNGDDLRVVVARDPDGQIAAVVTNPADRPQHLSLAVGQLSPGSSAVRHQLTLQRAAGTGSRPPEGSEIPLPTDSKVELRGDDLEDDVQSRSVSTYVIPPAGASRDRQVGLPCPGGGTPPYTRQVPFGDDCTTPSGVVKLCRGNPDAASNPQCRGVTPAKQPAQPLVEPGSECDPNGTATDDEKQQCANRKNKYGE